VRVVFLGTPVHAVPYLDVIAAEHDLVAVVTQPDRPQGRSRAAVSPPVKEAAQSMGVPVFQPPTCACDDLHETLRAMEPDLLVVTAYGQILPCHLLDLPRLGAINVHYSLLPQLRGAAPVQCAILEGLTRTGVTVQYVAEKVDRGDIIAAQTEAIRPEDRTDTLTARLTIIGCGVLGEAMRAIGDGSVVAEPQDDSRATYAPLLTKDMGRIDWRRSADQIDRQVRGCYPWPVAWYGDESAPVRVLAGRPVVGREVGGDPGTVVEILRDEGFVVACGSGELLIREIQPAGRRRMVAVDYLRGARLAVGDPLG
jgi:methionyl-tRNA formyltransferase